MADRLMLNQCTAQAQAMNGRRAVFQRLVDSVYKFKAKDLLIDKH
jgi:hypothetical protein